MKEDKLYNEEFKDILEVDKQNYGLSNNKARGKRKLIERGFIWRATYGEFQNSDLDDIVKILTNYHLP